jgi:hypothetical protein
MLNCCVELRSTKAGVSAIADRRYNPGTGGRRRRHVPAVNQEPVIADRRYNLGRSAERKTVQGIEGISRSTGACQEYSG